MSPYLPCGSPVLHLRRGSLGVAACFPQAWYKRVIIGDFSGVTRGWLGGHRVTEGYGPADEAAGKDRSAEPQALTSTCSRLPPPRLRESSLVSAAACGPGCSQGRRGLVTCCWPFMLWMATQTGLANSGGLSHTYFLRARSLHSRM